jgi:hypothetical protein
MEIIKESLTQIKSKELSGGTSCLILSLGIYLLFTLVPRYASLPLLRNGVRGIFVFSGLLLLITIIKYKKPFLKKSNESLQKLKSLILSRHSEAFEYRDYLFLFTLLFDLFAALVFLQKLLSFFSIKSIPLPSVQYTLLFLAVVQSASLLSIVILENDYKLSVIWNTFQYWFVVFFSVLTIGTLLIFLVYIVKDANWIFGDNHIFWESTLQGKPINVFHQFRSGRFLPFAFLEYNLFIPWGNSPYIYYAWNCLKFLLTIVFLYMILQITYKKVNIQKPIISYSFFLVFCLFLFLISPSMFRVYANIIFAESTLITLLAIFIYFHMRGFYSGKIRDLVLSIIFINLAMYFKEPVSGAVLALVLTEIFFSTKNSKRRVLYLSLLFASVILFLFLYYLFVFQTTSSFYNVGRTAGLSRKDLLLNILRSHPYFLLVGLTSFIRGFQFIINRKASIYDGLLLAGSAYIVSFAILRLQSAYYFTPAYILTLPVVFYLLCRGATSTYRLLRICTFLSIFLFVLTFASSNIESFTKSINSINRQRKEFMPSVVAFINDVQRGNKKVVFYQPQLEGFAYKAAKWRGIVMARAFQFVDSDFILVRIDDLQDLKPDESVILLVPHEVKESWLEPIEPFLTKKIFSWKGIKIITWGDG